MGKIEIDTELCKGCRFCVRYCPQKILEIGKKYNGNGFYYPVVTAPEKCVGCAICATMCPDMAITVYR